MTAPTPGRYEHFRGAPYEVLGTARHSETEELLVVYRQGYGDRAMWVRPAAMWSERVQRDGYDGPRFRRIDEATDARASEVDAFEARASDADAAGAS